MKILTVGDPSTRGLSQFFSTLLLIGVFLAAFFFRAYRPLSRVHVWLTRSELLIEAVRARDWAGTFGGGSSHPGFTTTVIGGAALSLFDGVKGTPLEAVFRWAFPPYATEFGQRIAVGVVGLSLVIAVLIVLITLTARKLAGWPLALTVGGLLAFSPFFMAQSRVFHVDALMSTLMLLSSLLLLLSLDSGQKRYLVLSGLVAGFAVLTKVPSLFLIPYTALALLVYTLRALKEAWAMHGEDRGRWLAGELWRRLVGPMALWLVMLFVPFLLWPVMWVEPLAPFQRISRRTGQHLETGHDRRFFLGQIYDFDHPSLFFYPVALLFESTFLSLTLFVVAVVLYGAAGRRFKLPLKPVTFWLMLAYVIFFTVQMTIGAAQDARYVLPAALMIELMAGVGLVSAALLLRHGLQVRTVRAATLLPGGLIALVVGVQALVALSYTPNYGAHHNHLLGGNRIAINVLEISAQNEGITFVADYLSQQPDAENLRVGVSRPIHNSLLQYFDGEVNQEGMDSDDDYHLFSVVAFQRYYRPKFWEHAWELYQGSPPQLLVMVDGVAYMWLYATEQPATSQPIVIRRGGGTIFVALAWIWTLSLIGALVWSLRRPSRERVGVVPETESLLEEAAT